MLNDVMTIKEASERYNVSIDSIKRAIYTKKFNDNEVNKSAGVWLISLKGIERIYRGGTNED